MDISLAIASRQAIGPLAEDIIDLERAVAGEVMIEIQAEGRCHCGDGGLSGLERDCYSRYAQWLQQPP